MELLNLKELDGTAVEEIVAKPMSKLHAEQMSEELTKLYLNLLMVDPDYRVPQIEEEFLFRMITSRLECYQFTLDFRTKVILMYVAQSSRSFDAFRFINAYSCFFHASAFGST